MIRPTKHNHPDKTLVYASYLILKKIHKSRIEKYDDLLIHITSVISNGEHLFTPALNFLFLLDLIKYHPKTDSIEYLEKNETLESLQ